MRASFAVATAAVLMHAAAIRVAGQLVTEFPVPAPASFPLGITAGPDSNLWFTEQSKNQIGRITPRGDVTEFPLTTPASLPTGITEGPDGNLWFTERGANQIGSTTTDGFITEYPLLIPGSEPNGITAGPDSNLWFTARGHIGQITPGGDIAEFPLAYAGEPGCIATGPPPETALWFTEPEANRIGRITVDGVVTVFPMLAPESNPIGIASGPDGNVWFTERGANKIGRISPAGSVSEFPVPTANSRLGGIDAGPDGNLWFAEELANQIGRITPEGAIEEFALPSAGGPQQITEGPDPRLWFTKPSSNQIGRIAPPATPTPELTSTPTLTVTATPTLTPRPGACTTDGDCAAGHHCRAGVCVLIRECGDAPPNPDRRNCAARREACTNGACECGGDCDLDGVVLGNEVSRMVCVLAGQCPPADCVSGDFNGDTQITSNEVCAAVSNLGAGCPNEGITSLSAPLRLDATRALEIGSVVGPPGTVITVRVSLSGGGGVATAQIDLLFDPTVLLPPDPATACTVDPRLNVTEKSFTFVPEAPGAPPGKAMLRLFVADLSLCRLADPAFPARAFDAGPLLSCTFQINPDAALGRSEITGERVNIGDDHGNTFSATATSGGVIVGDICAGDCGSVGMVSTGNLLTLMSVALGNASVDACTAGDADSDGRISIDEIVTAVHRAANSCGLAAGY